MVMADIQIPSATTIDQLLRKNGWDLKSKVQIENLRIASDSPRKQRYFFHLRSCGTARIANHLILKVQPDAGREVKFYANVRHYSLPIASCYAVQDGAPGMILLEDLSASHEDLSAWPIPVPLEAARQVLEAVAQFHAFFWQIEQDIDFRDAWPDYLINQQSYGRHLERLAHDLQVFALGMSHILQPSQVRLFYSVLAYLPRLWDEFWKERLEKRWALPLIHGDLNPRNVFYPKDMTGKVTLIDWEAHRRGTPACDLAMLLGLHLCPHQADAAPLLKLYHQALTEAGVADYSFDDLMQDYQAELLYQLFFPLKLYSQFGIQDQTMIENAILAVESFSDVVI